MSNLQQRQEKIASKRKQTSFRDFLMEICSWVSVMFYKNNGLVSSYPPVNRVSVVSLEGYLHLVPNGIVPSGLGFFVDMKNLFDKNPLATLNHWGENENAQYADTAVNVKDAYLSFTVTKGSQNICYSFMLRESTDVFNSVYVVDGSNNVFGSKCVIGSAFIFYSNFITNSNNIWFSSNLIGCSECINCSDLENKSYCIDNIQYPKEEYQNRKNSVLSQKTAFERNLKQLQQEGKNYASTGSTGNFVIHSDSIEDGYIVYNGKKGHNVCMVGSIDDGGDRFDFFLGGAGSSHIYGTANSGNNSQHIYCCRGMGRCHSCFYSYKLEDCSFCLGCIGLKNKSFCIFNKQYTKEERYAKVDEIFAQMEKDWTLGQFFPATMNPFYFNDTAAYLIDPSFTKEEVTAKGYLRRDEPIKVDIPADAQVVKSNDLDQFEKFDEQGNRMINADILKYVIQDEQGNYYRIIPMEYKFLMKHALPLPRKHWLDRMKENFRIS